MSCQRFTTSIFILSSVFTLISDEATGTEQPLFLRMCEEYCALSGTCLSPGNLTMDCVLPSAIGKSFHTVRRNTTWLPTRVLIPESKEHVVTKISELCQQVWPKPQTEKGYLRLKAGTTFIKVKMHEKEMNWSSARRVCMSEGGDLVKVDTRQKEHVIKKKFVKADDMVYGFYKWIGLTDMEDENNFKWTDGTPLKFSNWGPSDPNNVVINGTDEDCVAMTKIAFYGFYWLDIACWHPHGFICEIR